MNEEDAVAIVRAQSTLTYWFYAPNSEMASALVDDLADRGLVCEEYEPSDDEWLVVIGGDSSWRDRSDEMTEIAGRHNAVYDGWETSAIPVSDRFPLGE